MLTEAAARWMLVLHTALGVAAVGAATHLVLWSRGLLRGELGRLRAVRRFAWIVLVLQLGAFAAGNVMYPTYKVEVRAAYLENREALVAAQALHAGQLARVAETERSPEPRAKPEAPDQRSEGSAEFGQWRESDTPTAKRAATCEAGQDEPNDSEASDVRGGRMKYGRLAAQEDAAAPQPSATGELVRRAAGAARWFDVKEHWIALGILGSLALVLVLGFWDPRAGARELVPVVFGLSVVIAGTLWLGAVIGVLTASWRAV